jgi:hypothetical protein
MCCDKTCSYFNDKISNSSIVDQTFAAVFGIDLRFLRCVNDYSYRSKLFWAMVAMISTVVIVKFVIGTRESQHSRSLRLHPCIHLT